MGDHVVGIKMIMSLGSDQQINDGGLVPPSGTPLGMVTFGVPPKRVFRDPPSRTPLRTPPQGTPPDGVPTGPEPGSRDRVAFLIKDYLNGKVVKKG